MANVRNLQDRHWRLQELLELSRKRSDNPDLTLEELQPPIFDDQQQQQYSANDDPAFQRPRLDACDGTTTTTSTTSFAGLKDGSPDASSSSPPTMLTRTHVVEASDDVQLEVQAFTESLHSVSNITNPIY